MRFLLEERSDFARFLDGAPSPGARLVDNLTELQAFCEEQELNGLLHHRIGELRRGEWPQPWWNSLADYSRTQAATELLRASEIRSVLRDLAVAGVKPILFKGTALAYSVYPSAVCRPRNDTDVLIAPEHVEAARRVFINGGYRVAVQCAELLSQFEVQRVDRFGVLHVFDVHWKISTQAAFEHLLTYDDLVGRSQTLPALGPDARSAGRIDALLLACVHPAMHHRNLERALWIYDVHLLASAIAESSFVEFAERAEAAGVCAVAAHALRRAQSIFKTPVPDWALARLEGARCEPSAAYLASERRWHHELVSSVRALPTLGRRLAFAREILFPSPQYVLGAYGLQHKPLSLWLLPALYAHRNLRGAWRVLTGKK